MASVGVGGGQGERAISMTRFTDWFLPGYLKRPNAMCHLKYCSHHSEKIKNKYTWFRSLCQLTKDLCIFHEHQLETRVFFSSFPESFSLKVHSRGSPLLTLISSGFYSSPVEHSAVFQASRPHWQDGMFLPPGLLLHLHFFRKLS